MLGPVAGAIDENLLARYAHVWTQWLAAQAELEKEESEGAAPASTADNPPAESPAAARKTAGSRGIVTATVDSRGRKRKGTQSPWFLIAMKLGEQLTRLENLLGMSPASRQRLEMPAMEPAADPAEDFFSTKPLKLASDTAAS